MFGGFRNLSTFAAFNAKEQKFSKFGMAIFMAIG
jgi:hypothetical protein